MKPFQFGIIGVLLVSSPAFAFNSLTHEELIKSALTHMERYRDPSGAAARWLGLEDTNKKERIKELLIRSTVDEDYRANIWLDASFHSPFAGAMGDAANIFTTFSHHLNVTVPGTYWKYDGYAYKNTDGKGNDKYLAISSVQVKGDVSNALGGTKHARFSESTDAHFDNPNFDIEFIGDNDLGAYKAGFLGTEGDWNRMFFGDNHAKDAFFPPAYVPAELAYERVMASSPAQVGRQQEWIETISLASGIFSSDELKRRFWRSEIEGLPKAFDLMGTVLHIAQDLNVPHHTQGIGYYCHPELETLGDTLSCGREIDVKPFDLGNYDVQDFYQDCQRLYDPALVESIRTNIVHPIWMNTALSISDRLIEVAKQSARWKWGKDPLDEDKIKTVLPDGLEIVGKDCKQILTRNEVRAQLKYQYNAAVATTVVLFEAVAKEYQKIP